MVMSDMLTFVFDVLAKLCSSSYFWVVIMLFSFMAVLCIVKIIREVVTINV